MKKKFSSVLLLLLCIALLYGCGLSNKDTSTRNTPQEQDLQKQTAKQQTEEGDSVAEVIPDDVKNEAESLYGTWYINSTDATIWINNQIEDEENPSSDFTVKNFNLETLSYGSDVLNATYHIKNNFFSYETFSGSIVSFQYKINFDGSLAFSKADTGETMILTRGDSSDQSAIEASKTGEEAFIPDYIPGNENIYGQPDRNLASVDHSEVGIQDEWIYYSNGAALYKMKYTEGSSTAQKIGDYNAWGINVVGDWIYFGIPESNTINKVRTDGTMFQTLVEGRIEEDSIYVADYYLFYKERVKKSASESESYLVRMDLNTGEAVRLESNLYLFWGVGETIYYCTDNEINYCIDFDGNEIGQYSTRSLRTQYYGSRQFNWYSNGYGVYRLAEYFDDGNYSLLMEDGNVGAFYVSDNYIYFSMTSATNFLDDYEYGFFGYNIDTGETWQINGDTPTNIWSCGDGYLYYSLSNSTYVYPTYKCKLDGSDWEDIRNSMYPN